MCVAEANPWWAETDPYQGYQIQVAKEGEELTNEQKEKNWALGGQSYNEAFGIDQDYGRSPRTPLEHLGNIGMKAHKNKIRAQYSGVRRPAPSAPIPEEESEPGQGYSLKGKSTQDDVSQQKYAKESLKVGSVKKGTKKLKALDTGTQLPSSASDKSGLNI